MFHKQYRLGDFTFGLTSPIPLEIPDELSIFESPREIPQTELQVPANSNPKMSAKQLLEDLNLRSLLLEQGAIVLHASYIVRDGKAVLFCAPCGTGKSTQAALWEKYRGAEIVNGDRVLLQSTSNGFTANGVFYCGSSGICKNISAPLGAVVVLRQGKNEIRKMNGLSAFKAILTQSGYDVGKARDIELASSIIAELINTSKIFQLDAAIDEQAVIVLENAMKG